ncbi:hypothetical protein KJ953_03830 [Patescibacteria group bacterium]|nr:hypothetical protein [Patescibacteria group bacterium]MBU1256837.1 hypothetical protein [Patescibacteria group bacterium]MBU1457861.1 hypothetical protein [Patescibacteria group bacterium]
MNKKITLPNPTKSNFREGGRCIIGLFIIGLMTSFCWLSVYLTSLIAIAIWIGIASIH